MKEQILKTRDDRAPLRLVGSEETPESQDIMTLAEGECSWAKVGESFGTKKLRERIEPWLTALVQSEHLSLLIGSGLTHGVHQLATDASVKIDDIIFEALEGEVATEAKRSAEAAGRECGNIEDQIRAANELLRGLEILATSRAEDDEIHTQIAGMRSSLEKGLRSFVNSILNGESGLITAPMKKREVAFNYLVSFLMSFASRAAPRERLHILTTNYDRLIEAGADVAGLRLIDRFVGTLEPVFRSSRLDIDLHYNPPGIRGEPRYLEGVARYTKLHGSVDWIDCESSIRRLGLPFGAREIDPYLNAPGLSTDVNSRRLMIYPNAAKDRETATYPYVDLFRDFASTVCRPNSTLMSYGYSFGDEHINRVIKDMLTIPSSHLVIISYNDPLGRIRHIYDTLGRPAQITLLVGDHLASLQSLVDFYLPKPAIDRTSLRMSELLRDRWARGETERRAGEEPTEGGTLP